MLGLNARLVGEEAKKPKTRITGEWAQLPPYPIPALPLVDARLDRFSRITVGLRPFRAGGPNVSVETIGAKTVVHNYGHGGSGWSLSWGTGLDAREKVLATGAREIAVLGSGVIGLTTATLLQKAGCRVTIYTKARAPEVTSQLATGVWSPYSRVALKAHDTPEFRAKWDGWCRASFQHFQFMLGLPNDPVAWRDRYAVSEIPWDQAAEKAKQREKESGEPEFVHYTELVKDLTPEPSDLARGTHPFAQPFVKRSAGMTYNLNHLLKMYAEDFLREGGRFVVREFHSTDELATLPEATIVNATGLGAATLFGDKTMTPVRGQLGVLLPQPEINYGLSGEGFGMTPRRDGIVVQYSRKGDFGSTDLSPDREEAEKALLAMAKVVAGQQRVT